MSGENRRLVADEPVEFKTSGNLPIILEESKEYTSNAKANQPYVPSHWEIIERLLSMASDSEVLNAQAERVCIEKIGEFPRI